MIRRQTCPICERELPANAEAPHFPFCSPRCKQVDLFRWAEGRYAIVDDLDPASDEFPEQFDDADPDSYGRNC